MSTVNSALTSHIAHLASLPLTQDQIALFSTQLTTILAYVDMIQSVDTKGVEETSQVTGLENILREDVVDETRTFPQEEALSQARNTHGGYFVVPQLIEQ